MSHILTLHVFKIHLYETFILRGIVNTFGVSFSNNVALFVQKHVLPYENIFLYCLRSNIRHYGEYSNTPLEGTNFGLKHSSISTHPGLSMDNSMMILSQLSNKHITKVNSTVIRQSNKQCVNYKNKVHDKLTIMGSSMLANTYSLVNRYKCIRVDVALWKVRKKILLLELQGKTNAFLILTSSTRYISQHKRLNSWDALVRIQVFMVCHVYMLLYL